MACQSLPLSCVTHSSGPNAHPLTPSRNRMPLTPSGPAGAPVTGACSPCQVWPVSLVHATEVQMLPLKQVPGLPAWPMTQARDADTKVTDVGAKSAGSGPGLGPPGVPPPEGEAVGVGVRRWPEPFGWGDPFGFVAPPVVDLPGPAATFPASEGVVTWRAVTPGTATATPAATAATEPTVTASLRIFRLRARREIRSNVPGGGDSGRTCSCSQLSSGSRSSLSGIACPIRRQCLPKLRPGMV